MALAAMAAIARLLSPEQGTTTETKANSESPCSVMLFDSLFRVEDSGHLEKIPTIQLDDWLREQRQMDGEEVCGEGSGSKLDDTMPLDVLLSIQKEGDGGESGPAQQLVGGTRLEDKQDTPFPKSISIPFLLSQAPPIILTTDLEPVPGKTPSGMQRCKYRAHRRYPAPSAPPTLKKDQVTLSSDLEPDPVTTGRAKPHRRQRSYQKRLALPSMASASDFDCVSPASSFHLLSAWSGDLTYNALSVVSSPLEPFVSPPHPHFS